MLCIVLRVLFFIGVHHQFKISTFLSKNQLELFWSLHKTAQSNPSYVDPSLLQWLLDSQQDWTSPAWTQWFNSFVQRAYQIHHRKHTSLDFVNLQHFALPTQLPHRSWYQKTFFVIFVISSSQSLSPQTIKVYLAGIRHMQIAIGLPDLKEFSSMPQLKLVQSGIQCYTSEQQTKTVKIR